MSGAMVRSRAVLNSQWEKPSSFFLNLEKKIFLNKSIPELIDETGNTQTNMNKIMEMQYSYYKDLFTSKPTVPIPDSKYDYLTTNLPKLPEQQSDLLDLDITIEELELVIKQAKFNKAPGPDGYSNEFFKTFCTELLHWIFRSYKQAITVNALSPIIKRGTITCIPKQEKRQKLTEKLETIDTAQQHIQILFSNSCK